MRVRCPAGASVVLHGHLAHAEEASLPVYRAVSALPAGWLVLWHDNGPSCCSQLLQCSICALHGQEGFVLLEHMVRHMGTCPRQQRL